MIKFTHKQGPGLGQGNSPSIDGASQDCTDYFIQTVYQPHFDRFQDDFGKTIPGFFYDEPETRGDWGTELNKVLAEWQVDWKKAYVAHTLKLAGEDDTAAKFQYLDAFAEAWGRTMYGTMSRWCRERGVKSMGHFMEHGYLYVHPEFCAGDMMRLAEVQRHGRDRPGRPPDVPGPASARHLPDAQAGQFDHARVRQGRRHHHVRDVRRLRAGHHVLADEMADRPDAGARGELHDPALLQSQGPVRHRLPALLLQRRLRAALPAVSRLCRLHQPAVAVALGRAARLPGGGALRGQPATRGQDDHARGHHLQPPGRLVRLRLAAHGGLYRRHVPHSKARKSDSTRNATRC